MFRFIVICTLFTFQNIYGQFANGKMIPDPATPKIQDFNDISYKLSTTINQRDLESHVHALASADFEGRETGANGNAKAAEYIAAHFKKIGLAPISGNQEYYQKLAFTFTQIEQIDFKINNREYKALRDVLIFPHLSENSTINDEHIQLVGYGVDSENYSDYKNYYHGSEVFLAIDGEPQDADGRYKTSNDLNASEWSHNWILKSEAAKKHGAKLLLLVVNDLKSFINENRSQIVNRVTELGDKSQNNQDLVNTIFISPKIAEDLMGIDRDLFIAMRNDLSQNGTQMTNIGLKAKIEFNLIVSKEVVKGQNVLGYIEGSDLKDQIVIVSAHYDHIGKRGNDIFYGADDNASGSSAVLEIAEALATAKKMNLSPRRSVLCILVTGEEKGLLGSEYYVENPMFPISNTIADINIDMIGRRGNDYLNSTDPYVYVIGSDRISQELHDLNEEVNRTYSGMLLDYKYNDEADPNRFYYRSDHYNFARKGIPSIFFFSGVHKDYHRVSDTLDKIDFPLLQKRSQLIFHTLWRLANQATRLTKDFTP